MTFTSLRVALVCVLLAGVTGVAPSAQTTRAQNRPPAPVEVQPERPPVERETDSIRFSGFRRPIFRGLQDYTLRAGDVVREVRTVFGNVTIEGHVERDVVVVMGSARTAATAVVEGSLVVIGGSAEVEPGATIGRDVVVIGGTLTAPADFSPHGEHVVIGSPLFGDALRDVLPWVTHGLLWGRLIVPDLEWIWAIVGVFFLVYLALNTVFDRPVGATADVVIDRPLSAFVGGLLVLLLAVPVLAIVAATVIGLAVVPFLLCGLIVAGLIGKTAVARAIGRGIVRVGSPEGRFAAFAAFLIGFGLLTLAYMVPLLGFVTWALTSVLGLGAATTTFRAHLRRERKAAAPAQPVSVAPLPAPAAEAADVHSSLPPPLPAAAPVVEPPPPPPLFNQGLAQYPRATFLDRLAAFVLDCILVAIANGLLDMRRNDEFFFFLLLGYHIAFWAWRGTTLGGIICNLRVTRTDGAELRFVDALVRGLSSIFSIAALGIGCFWMLQDPERQTWHDKIAGTLVVKVPRDVVLP
ncbi:MAG TPA: RDD family protein [Vicinamibacterales bacterium]|nr:RDD family protein [Vicinamibacterales bacterium]